MAAVWQRRDIEKLLLVPARLAAPLEGRGALPLGAPGRRLASRHRAAVRGRGQQLCAFGLGDVQRHQLGQVLLLRRRHRSGVGTRSHGRGCGRSSSNSRDGAPLELARKPAVLGDGSLSLCFARQDVSILLDGAGDALAHDAVVQDGHGRLELLLAELQRVFLVVERLTGASLTLGCGEDGCDVLDLELEDQRGGLVVHGADQDVG